MCGIAGVRRFGEVPISAEEIKILLMSLEHRGNHATGIALMSEGQVHVHKAAQPAWKFCGEKDTDNFLDEHLPNATTALLHTRYATVGSPGVNENNHPMFAGRAAVVHNGGIGNHEYIFNQVLKTERSCETDSDVFRAALDVHGMTPEAIEAMNKFVGSAAIAAVTTDNPELLLLARSGSPLVYGVTQEKLWWASEISAIQKAVRPWEKVHGLYARKFRNDVSYFTVPDHTAYLLTRDGLDRRFEFKVCSHYRAPLYNMRESYHKHRAREREEGKNVTVVSSPNQPKHKHKLGKCPGCDKKWFIPIEDKWYGYNCSNPACKRSLSPLDNAKPGEIEYGTFITGANA